MAKAATTREQELFDNKDDWLTVKDFADLAHATPGLVRKWIHKGVITPGKKRLRMNLIHRTELGKVLSEHPLVSSRADHE